MSKLATLQTRRLTLRPLRSEDLAPLTAMNADPRVAEHLPAPLTEEQSRAMFHRLVARTDPGGFGVWAVEVPDVAPFVGFVGLAAPSFETPFTPCIEIAWRLMHEHWGHGYATEAARAAMTFGFASARLDEIVSFTVPRNVRSLGVMRKLGMHSTAKDDFDHPSLPEGHPLRRHVLYRLERREWLASGAGAPRKLLGDAISVAENLARALDADEFERARPWLAEGCVYEVRGATHVGADAILASYARATREAHRAFDDVRYESRVEPVASGARVEYTDILRRGDREHRHRSAQELTVNAGRVTRIVHVELPGERDALQAFLR